MSQGAAFQYRPTMKMVSMGLRIAGFSLLFCLAGQAENLTSIASGQSAPTADFAHPPAGSRILKIIHSWPDDPAAQDALIQRLAGQGFGGVVCNVSFKEYLVSDAKWKAFTRAVEEAKKAGFALWLYDEKGYPSGTAGGIVLRGHPEWEARGLLISDAEVRGHASDAGGATRQAIPHRRLSQCAMATSNSRE